MGLFLLFRFGFWEKHPQKWLFVSVFFFFLNFIIIIGCSAQPVGSFSPTRDWIRALGSESTQSSVLDHWESPDWWFRCSWLCFSGPSFVQLPSPHNAAQGLKILTFSSSHPVRALKAKQAKQAKRKNWFAVFQFPDHCPGCVCYSQGHFPFCLLHSRCRKSSSSGLPQAPGPPSSQP